MKNSIRDELDKNYVITEIDNMLKYPTKEKPSIIVVEGQDDIKFFEKVKNDSIILYESYSGKNGVKEIVEHFNSVKVIGVCDRDYEDPTKNSDKIFYYDFCNLEMMMLSKDVVIKNLLSEARYKGIYKNNFRENLRFCHPQNLPCFILSF